MKDRTIIALAIVGVIATPLAIMRGCNSYFNNKEVDHPSYQTHSFATGIDGHTEFTRYEDGSQEVLTIPSLHRMWESRISLDIDGDNIVDRIRIIDGEHKSNKSELLIREDDFDGDRGSEFYYEDKKMRELSLRFP